MAPEHSFSELASFVRVVELGSFSAAARELDQTPSSLSKLVSRLEQRLGVRLLHRSTRKLALTAEGELYAARCGQILDEMRELDEQVSSIGGRPSGLLRMGVGSAFGLHQLAPALPRFLARHPEVRLELSVTDRRVDILESGADLMLRIGALDDSALTARRICTLERIICAAPAYLARRGTPRTPADLAAHDCLYITGMPELRRWPFVVGGAREFIEVSGTAGSDNAETLLQLGIAGVGVIRLADVIVGPELARGRLVPLLTDVHISEVVPVYAVCPAGRQRAPKVAAMIDFLVDEFAGRPWALDGAGAG
ncbi:MAG: LysR family transcriptional regulator [Rhodocyclaceae bacterium]|nr:LysR family transcriptional regulator [Rhodocyclaceae bacterium]